MNLLVDSQLFIQPGLCREALKEKKHTLDMKKINLLDSLVSIRKFFISGC